MLGDKTYMFMVQRVCQNENSTYPLNFFRADKINMVE